MRLLEGVRTGDVSIDKALAKLVTLPYEDIGFARVDHHRAIRTGLPEVVFCQGKQPEQVVTIMGRLCERNPVVMGSRADAATYAAVSRAWPNAMYFEAARIVAITSNGKMPAPSSEGTIAVVCAGTSDFPVVEEAAISLELMGDRVQRFVDVGVAGIHRLLSVVPALREARAAIVVAGMEGALPGVVAGLIGRPVIAVPTSVGYGTSFGGVAPLLTMLNSCAPGLAVVNIDNGYGAAVFAHMINTAGTRV